jgi:hypothetical protein
MIKIQNNSATRKDIPAFLQGLSPETLLDLSWTDPQLGVQDCAWWPEEDQSPTLEQFQVYGEETLTIDTERKVVVVSRAVQPMPQEEVDALNQAQADQVRSERNQKLSQSDWTQGKDIADDVSTAWATYRQALRDITLQAGFPSRCDLARPCLNVMNNGPNNPLSSGLGGMERHKESQRVCSRGRRRLESQLSKYAGLCRSA